MQWWCAAQGVPWDWSWQPYPGVWLAVLGLAWAYRRGRAVSERAASPGNGDGGWRLLPFVLGLILLWAALDWPVGPLGAGYLASVHMAQFLLIGLASPVLLLMSLPRGCFASLRRSRWVGPLERLTHPAVAFITFNAILVATHLPEVVDGLMRTQLGSFTIDLLWFAGGSLLWWPVACPVPEHPRFSGPLKMGYLFLNMIPATALAAFLIFSDYPLYSLYELAPPTYWLSTRDDQLLAGLLMKFGGAAIHWTAITVLFFRWYRRETRESGYGYAA